MTAFYQVFLETRSLDPITVHVSSVFKSLFAIQLGITNYLSIWTLTLIMGTFKQRILNKGMTYARVNIILPSRNM